MDGLGYGFGVLPGYFPMQDCPEDTRIGHENFYGFGFQQVYKGLSIDLRMIQFEKNNICFYFGLIQFDALYQGQLFCRPAWTLTVST